MKMSMAETVIFGSAELNIQYTERRAAYVVILARDGKIAMVRGRHRHFLPGGGSLPNEAPEDTAIREVREELARSVRLTRKLGEAIQYFYSAADDRHYKMDAAFFAGEFTDGASDDGAGEHELCWLPVAELEHACFHECHAWAARRA
jgi:8-oxo-dGTP pyrophosphatase MutT (NUDIX family)